jgi:transposase-like protein
MRAQLNKPSYEGMNLLKFQQQFSDENDCLNWLSATRWPNGFQCPRCGQGEYLLMEPRHLYLCKACRYQASVTAGTIFHKTKTPLLKWFCTGSA